MKKSKRFIWPQHMTTLFYKSRRKIANLIREGVKAFVMGKTTLVAGDWSKIGIGYSLKQKHCQCPMSEAPKCGVWENQANIGS